MLTLPRSMARYLLVLCRNHYQFSGGLKSPPFYSDFDKKRFDFGLEIVPQIFLPFQLWGFCVARKTLGPHLQ